MTLALGIDGAGDPVVFLHGSPTPPDVLAPIARVVAEAHLAVQVALPGYGRSPALPAPSTLDDIHRAIEAALLDRDLRSVSLVGFSSGGYHALALAARRVLDVRSVVCLGGFIALDAEERRGLGELARLVRDGVDFRATAGDRFLSPGFGRAHPDAVRAVGAWFDATSPAHLASELEAFSHAPDLRTAIAPLGIPILARVGSEDVAAPPSKSEAIVAAARRGTLEIAAGAGHALMLEDLEDTIAATRRGIRARADGAP